MSQLFSVSAEIKCTACTAAESFMGISKRSVNAYCVSEGTSGLLKKEEEILPSSKWEVGKQVTGDLQPQIAVRVI